MHCKLHSLMYTNFLLEFMKSKRIYNSDYFMMYLKKTVYCNLMFFGLFSIEFKNDICSLSPKNYMARIIRIYKPGSLQNIHW